MTGKATKVFICICVIMLHAHHTEAEVSPNFEHCRQFFYQNTPPSLNGLVNSKQLCQKYKDNTPRFATSYDTTNRIPHYSAYTVESFKGPGCRYNGWFIEPQLSDNKALEYMSPWNRNEENKYKGQQAVNSDYTGSGYDRGHLNPSGYHCQTNEARASTNTLTNVAPQVHSFNNREWNTLERALLNIGETYCNFGGANRYFITGVIPSAGKYLKMPSKRVNIPDYYWTAVCCDSSRATNPMDRNEGWSVGFLAENKENTTVVVYHIQDFLSSQAPNLFTDYVAPGSRTTVKNCLFNPTNAEIVINKTLNLGPEFVQGTIVKPSYFQRVCNGAYSVYCYIKGLFG